MIKQNAGLSKDEILFSYLNRVFKHRNKNLQIRVVLKNQKIGKVKLPPANIVRLAMRSSCVIFYWKSVNIWTVLKDLKASLKSP